MGGREEAILRIGHIFQKVMGLAIRTVLVSSWIRCQPSKAYSKACHLYVAMVEWLAILSVGLVFQRSWACSQGLTLYMLLIVNLAFPKLSLSQI